MLHSGVSIVCDMLYKYTHLDISNITYMLLHPCEGYFPCRGVITNLFPVEAILVTCARGQSGEMDAPASQFSFEFSLLTRNKTAQKSRTWWRDTAEKVRNKNYCHVYSEHRRRAAWPVQPLAVCLMARTAISRLSSKGFTCPEGTLSKLKPSGTLWCMASMGNNHFDVWYNTWYINVPNSQVFTFFATCALCRG